MKFCVWAIIPGFGIFSWNFINMLILMGRYVTTKEGPRWLSCPYMVKKILNSSSLELKDLGKQHWDSGHTKFVNMITLVWPWPVLLHKRPMVDFKIIWQQWLWGGPLLSQYGLLKKNGPQGTGPFSPTLVLVSIVAHGPLVYFFFFLLNVAMKHLQSCENPIVPSPGPENLMVGQMGN